MDSVMAVTQLAPIVLLIACLAVGFIYVARP